MPGVARAAAITSCHLLGELRELGRATATCDQKTYQGYHMFVPATSMPQTCAFSYQDYHMARDLGRTGHAGAMLQQEAQRSHLGCCLGLV